MAAPAPVAPAPKTTVVNKNFTIIEDGVVYRNTLTGFEPKRNYSDVPEAERFSDHACILYPEQRIATFNIGMQAIHNATPRAAQSHKFPMDAAAAPLMETPEMYKKRLENIFTFVKTELFDKDKVDTVVFQEAKAQPADTNTGTLDNPIDLAVSPIFNLDAANTQFKYNRQDELAILSKCPVEYHEDLPPIDNAYVNSIPTGMKKRPLSERINWYTCDAKKQAIFNLHIPGLDLKGPSVEQRRKNTLELIWAFSQELPRLDEKYKSYTLMFIGDFNVPLVDYANPDIYKGWEVPVQLHTTPDNQSFSYDDHTHGVAPGGNLDCLVVVEGAKKTKLKVTLLTPGPVAPPNNNSLSINTDDRISNGNENGKNGTNTPVVVKPDLTLPTLLRIGNGGQFDEYINVAEGEFKSKGDFAIHYIGGQKELQTLYGVYDSEQLRQLQLAFGVKKMTDKPPLMTLLEKKCKKDYLPTVVQALQERKETLQGELKTMTSTTQKGMRTAFLKVLDELLGAIAALPEVECPTEERPDAPVASGTTGCPCLDDLNLLRDLVVLVVKLLGATSPQVQVQLDAIKLDEILGLLDAGKASNAAAKLREVVGTLGELEGIDETAPGEKVQEVLEFIWTRIAPGEPVPTPLTKDVLLDKFRDILTNLTTALDTSVMQMTTLKRQIGEKDAEIRQLNAQMDALARQLADAEGGTATAEALAAAQTALATSQAEVAELTGQIRALKEAEVRKGKENAETASSHAAALAALQGQLAAAEEKQGDTQKQLDNIIANFDMHQEKFASTRATLEAAEAAKVAAEIKFESLQANHAALENVLARIEEELEALKQEKAALEASIAAGNATVQGQLRAKDAEIAAATAAAERARQEKDAAEIALGTVNTLLEEKDAEINALKQRATTAERTSAEKGEAAKATAAQLAELTAKLAAVEAELRALQDAKAEAEAAIATEREALTRRAAEMEGVIPGLQAKIAALQGTVEAAEKTAAEKTKETARVTAELATTKAALEKANQEHTAEKAETERKAGELRAKLSELEGRLRATEAAADAAGQIGSQQAAALASLQSEKDALNAELAALKSTGATQDQAIRDLSATHAAKIKECEERLAQLQKDKAAELAAQEVRHKEELAGRNARIEQIEAELATAKSTTTAAQEKADGNAAAAQRAANEKVAAAEKAAEEKGATNAETIQRLSTELATEQEAKRKCEEKLAALEAELSELVNQSEMNRLAAAKAAEMQASAAANNAEKTQLKESLAAKNRTIQTQKNTIGSLISVAESQQKELEELKGASKTTSGATNSAIRGQLNVLNSSIATLEKTLEKTIAINTTPSEETQERLTTLLSVILVDPELQDAAKAYFTSGDEDELEKLAAKKSNSGILSAELCDFYTYLYGIVNLQYKKLPSRFGSDILSNFKNEPAKDPETTKRLLKEIALLFQAFFIMGETSTIPADLTLSVDVPVISNFLLGLSVQPLKEEVSRNAFAREIVGLGFLGQLALVPKEGTEKVVLTKTGTNFIAEFVEDNQRHILPLSVLAVKLIQLLHNDLNEKYKDIRTKCGTVAEFKQEASASGAAAGAGQEGGGEDPEEAIDFDELLL